LEIGYDFVPKYWILLKQKKFKKNTSAAMRTKTSFKNKQKAHSSNCQWVMITCCWDGSMLVGVKF